MKNIITAFLFLIFPSFLMAQITAIEEVKITLNDLSMEVEIIRNANCRTDNGQAKINASGGEGDYSYLWSNGDTLQLAKDLAPGKYSVTLSDDNDSISDSVTIGISDLPLQKWGQYFHHDKPTLNEGLYLQTDDLISSPDSGFLVMGNFDDALVIKALRKYNKEKELEWSIDIVPLIHTVGGLKSRGEEGFVVYSKNRLLFYDWDGTQTQSFRWIEVDNIKAVWPVADDGLLVVATFEHTNQLFPENYGGKDVIIFQIDREGQIVWSNHYGGSRDDELVSLIAESDGGYLLAGSTYSNDYDISLHRGESDAWLLKLDGNGKVIWSKTFGGEGEDRFQKIIKNKNGFYGLLESRSETGDFPVSYKESIIAAFSPWGNIQHYFQVKTNTVKNTEPFDLEISSDGKLLVSVYHSWEMSTECTRCGYGLIAKIDLDGSKIWTIIEKSFQTRKLLLTPKKELLVAGYGWENWTTTSGLKKNWIELKIYHALTPLPNLSFPDSLTFCEGNDHSLEVSIPDADYLWSNGATSSEITADSSGTYWVQVSTAAECQATDTFTVQIIPNPLLSPAFPDTLAQCGAIAFDAGNPSASYEWSNGDTSQISIIDQTGFYQLQITSPEACYLLDSFYLDQSSDIFASLIPQSVSCFGFADGLIYPQVSGGIPPYQYLWNQGSVSDSLSNLSAGIYSVLVTDSVGCIQEFSVEVTQPEELDFYHEIHNTPDGLQTYLYVFPTGGTAPYSFEWEDGSTEDSLWILTPGFYFVTITDANACTLVTWSIPVFDVATGVNIPDQNQQISISPNPTSDFLNIEWPKSQAIKSLSIFDSHGKIIQNISIDFQQKADRKITFDLGTWAAGIYFVKLKTAAGIYSAKVVKMR